MHLVKKIGNSINLLWKKTPKPTKLNMSDQILKKSRKHKKMQFPWNFKKTQIW